MNTLDNFFVGVSNFFETGTNRDGKNICPKHGVEHTGKTTYSVAIDLYLYKQTNEEQYRTRLINRTERIIGLIGTENETYFFVPDGSPQWNMCNRVIDSGAAVDMLATVLAHKTLLRIPEQLAIDIEKIVRLVCDTYLVKAAVGKAHTNQRLWGATGLATAYSLFKESSWKQALTDSVERSLNEFRDDGSIPYVTDYNDLDTDASIVDTTTYYHSRHIVFAWHVLEQVGELNDEYKEMLVKAVDFLVGMYGSDGRKCLDLETKRWYFTSSYEVASHSYDIYALLKAYEYTKNEQYAVHAQKAAQQLFAHRVRKDGGINDHIGEARNFQCPYFWNSHCAWLTRVAVQIDAVVADTTLPNAVQQKWYPRAELYSFANDNYACKIRGSKKPTHSMWGPRVGGGSLLHFGVAKDGFANQLRTKEFMVNRSGNFYTHSFLYNPKEWSSISRKDFRAAVYYCLIELYARDFKTFVVRTLELLRKTFFLRRIFASHNATEVMSTVHSNGISFTSALAQFDGQTLPETILQRHYTCEVYGLCVKEKLSGSSLPATVHYQLPNEVLELRVRQDGDMHRSSNRLRFTSCRDIEVEYIIGVVANTARAN